MVCSAAVFFALKLETYNFYTSLIRINNSLLSKFIFEKFDPILGLHFRKFNFFETSTNIFDKLRYTFIALKLF